MSHEILEELHVVKVNISRMRLGTQIREYLFLTIAGGKREGCLDLTWKKKKKPENDIACLIREWEQEISNTLEEDYITWWEGVYTVLLSDGRLLRIRWFDYQWPLGEIFLSHEHSASQRLSDEEIQEVRDRIVPSLLVILWIVKQEDFIDRVVTV